MGGGEEGEIFNKKLKKSYINIHCKNKKKQRKICSVILDYPFIK